MAEEKATVLRRLRELKSEHEAAIGEGAGAAPGFTEDEASTRKSYRLVASAALADGVLSEADLKAAGLPRALDESE